MNKILLLCILIFLSSASYAQNKYFSREGKLDFFSKAPLEDIEAHSDVGIAIFETNSGEVIARVSIKSFEFEKSLMQEHFNENYLESDKYPHGEFRGKVLDFKEEDFFKTGKGQYGVEGELSIHGKTNKVKTQINIELQGELLKVNGAFKILIKDYNIKVPKLLVKNIAEEIDINFEYKLKKLD